MFDLDDLLSSCAAAATDPTPTLAVGSVMERAMSARTTLAATFGAPSQAHLDVLHSSGTLVILHAVWAPAMRFPPHDHRTWAVIGIYGGDEDNAFYRRSDAGLAAAGGRTVREGEVVVLGPEVIHAVTNPRARSFTGAIHVYGGPYLTAPRSQWTEPKLVEYPASFEVSRRIFEEANRRLETGAAEARDRRRAWPGGGEL